MCTIGALGLSLIGIGVAATPWSLFLCVILISLTRALLFLVVCILQIDVNPTARGTVMALQSASLEVGHVLGIAGIGLALVAFGDYAAAYQIAGVIALFTMTPVALFACRRTIVPAHEPAPALQGPVVSAYPVRSPQ